MITPFHILICDVFYYLTFFLLIDVFLLFDVFLLIGVVLLIDVFLLIDVCDWRDDNTFSHLWQTKSTSLVIQHVEMFTLLRLKCPRLW